MLEYLIDHHVHTDFSADCETDIETLINKARNLGLKSLMLTDHVDFDSPEPIFRDLIDYDEYIETLEKIQNKNKDLEILMGVEVGYQSHLHERLKEFLSSYPFEFVICSMHCCDGIDFYNGDFFKGKSQYQAYDEYFESVKKSVQNYNDFDVYGHLDYITRYGDYENKEIKYLTYKEVIDEILKLLVQNGKGIELNTSGFRYGLDVIHPSIDILKQYKQLGGEIITLGSDAHRPEDLQANFNQAINILKDLEYKAITQFRGRKPQFIDIK